MEIDSQWILQCSSLLLHRSIFNAFHARGWGTLSLQGGSGMKFIMTLPDLNMLGIWYMADLVSLAAQCILTR